MRFEYSLIALAGNGKRVTGRSKPAFMPSSRKRCIAVFAMRDGVPNAIIIMSASSKWRVSYSTSFCCMCRIFSLNQDCVSPSHRDLKTMI